MLLVILTLGMYWEQTLACSAAHLLQWVCCWEVTLVFSGVLGKDWRLSGLCAWSHALKAFLPALYRSSCENWTWIMKEEIIRCLWCPQKNRWYEISSLRWQSYRNVDQSLLAKLAAAAAGRASQGTVLEFSCYVPVALGGFTKCSSTSALRTGYVTWPSPVFYPGRADFFSSLLVCDCWLLKVEKKVTLVVVVAELGFLTIVQRSGCLLFYYLSWVQANKWNILRQKSPKYKSSE